MRVFLNVAPFTALFRPSSNTFSCSIAPLLPIIAPLHHSTFSLIVVTFSLTFAIVSLIIVTV